MKTKSSLIFAWAVMGVLAIATLWSVCVMVIQKSENRRMDDERAHQRYERFIYGGQI